MSTPAVIDASSRRLWILGSSLLRFTFALGLLIVFWIALQAPDAVLVFSILLAAAPIVWVLFRRELLNLFVVLSGFVLIAGYEAGFQISEILYGLYFLGYLGFWFFSRRVLYDEQICKRPEERVLVLFLTLVTLSFPLTILFDGSMKEFVSEWLSLSLLAFYFPIREAIVRHRRGVLAVVGAIAVVGLFVLVRNVLKFQNIVSSAEYAWQVARGRAVTNESLLLVPAVFSLAGAVFVRRWLYRLALSGIFLLFLAGVILTQSRGYWMAFIVGAAVMFLLSPRREKLTLLGLAGVTGIGILGIGLILFGDVVLLLVVGVAERFLSIMTATTQDISLVNRFIETSAVWEKIKHNPVLGYGMGVPYRVQDIILDITYVKAFAHNGYTALWYKFGFWGLGFMLYFLFSVVRNAIRVFKSNSASDLMRVASIAVASSFCALFLSAITSNPFYINDTMFIYGVMAGISGGCISAVERAKAHSLA